MERDWQQVSVTIKQPAMVDTLTKRFNVTAQSDTLASTVADLGPTTADDTLVECPFRQVVGGVMWLAGMTRPDIANAANSSGPPLTQSVREASEGSSKDPRLPEFNAGFRDDV